MGKKLCTLLLAFVIALTVAGCGGSADTPAADTPAAPVTEAPTAVPTAEPTAEPTEAPKAEAAWEITDSGINMALRMRAPRVLPCGKRNAIRPRLSV